MNGAGLVMTDALTAQDRCDRCGAQAYVRTVHEDQQRGYLTLLWCAHHWRQHQEVLWSNVVRDETDRLKEPEPSPA